jgi:hypothetical protein
MQRKLDPQAVRSFGKSTDKGNGGLQVGRRLRVCRSLDRLLRRQAQVLNRLGNIVAMAVVTSKVGVVVFQRSRYSDSIAAPVRRCSRRRRSTSTEL